MPWQVVHYNKTDNLFRRQGTPLGKDSSLRGAVKSNLDSESMVPDQCSADWVNSLAVSRQAIRVQKHLNKSPKVILFTEVVFKNKAKRHICELKINPTRI